MSPFNSPGSKKYKILVWVLALLTAVSMMLAGWAFLSRFSETNQIRHDNAQIWHAVVCAIEVNVANSTKLSAEDKRHFLRFYDRLLVEDAHSYPCDLTPSAAHR